MSNLLKTVAYFDVFESGTKDWEQDILPVIEDTINKDEFILVTADGEVRSDFFVAQMKDGVERGMRIVLQKVERLDEDHIRYQYIKYKPNETIKATLTATFKDGKAIRVEPETDDFSL